MLFNSAGTLIGQTADQSTLWATAGFQSMTLTAPSGQSLELPPGQYWGGVVAPGTTLPTFAESGHAAAVVSIAADSAFYNANVAAALSKCGVLATGITTTPANITPGSITQATGLPLWFGLL